MKPLTYLGFTIFSVFIQFCVMEFIHEKLQGKDSTGLNETAHQSSIIKKINRKPHALYYRTESDQQTYEAHNFAKFLKYNNSPLDDITLSTSTEVSSTTFDLIYDENASTVDEYFTTESYFTDSEFDNVTEITLFEKDTTTPKPSLKKKQARKEKCFCDLLYKKCDINCCCDDDCSEEEHNIFINCIENDRYRFQQKKILYNGNYATCRNVISTRYEVNDLFCAVAVNLPKKRVKSYFKFDEAYINATFKWNNIKKPYMPLDFKKKKYEYGDPIWLIQNDTIFSMYLPTSTVNNYCSGRKHIKFLMNESIKCNVKFEDLYMFPALAALERSKLISVTAVPLNTTLNSSTLFYTNWTLFLCNGLSCGGFNRSMLVPKCTEKYCENLALKYEYIFYYSKSRITNATLKLHMKHVSTSIPLMVQEIEIKWYLGNESIEDTIQLSGNPGYIPGLPIIVSSAVHNHTINFFNATFGKNVLSFPRNENGKCVWSIYNNETIKFGFNTRSKCRLEFKQNISSSNATNACLRLQTNIKESLRLHKKLFVSPHGNPTDVIDDNWVPLEVTDQSFVYGEYHTKRSKLNCYNLVTRYAIVVAFADVSGTRSGKENTIVKTIVDGTKCNLTFRVADLSTVLTIDVRFIDISRATSEYARAPHLHLHLPPNFFFDPSNKCYLLGGDILLTSFFALILLKLNK